MVRGLEESHVLHQAPWNIKININTPYTPLQPLHNPSILSPTQKNSKKIWWNEKKFVPLHQQSQIGRLAQLV